MVGLFELRDDAHFWDETPVTPDHIVESLKPAIDAGLALKSAAALDEHRVIVYGNDGPPDIKLLSLPMTAVRKNVVDRAPPTGTGPWLVDESMPVAEGIVIRPASGKSPVVRFVQAGTIDALDIMDEAEDTKDRHGRRAHHR
jgi:hypothetical protein